MLVDGYTPAEIVGEMLVVLLCGVRPMANTLARALWELSRQPMLQAKMQYSPRFAAATSAPGLGSPQPLMHRDLAHPCHICTGTGLTSATCAPGLGSPLPHLRRDWRHLCHICSRTGLTRYMVKGSLDNLGIDCYASCVVLETLRMSPPTIPCALLLLRMHVTNPLLLGRTHARAPSLTQETHTLTRARSRTHALRSMLSPRPIGLRYPAYALLHRVCTRDVEPDEAAAGVPANTIATLRCLAPLRGVTAHRMPRGRPAHAIAAGRLPRRARRVVDACRP
jgi:hypothetical protein